MSLEKNLILFTIVLLAAICSTDEIDPEYDYEKFSTQFSRKYEGQEK